MTRVLPYGARAALVDLDRPEAVLGLHAALRDAPPDGLVELVPAARTLLVRFDPARTNLERLTADLLARTVPDVTELPGEEIVVPVSYAGEDLERVAEQSGLTVREIVARHEQGSYVAAFCGFAPGFAYLTGLDPVLRLPRRSSPRTRVPAGAVAIAGEYTAVYPHASPGGWHLIGYTELSVWDVERAQPHLLMPGTRVRFAGTGR
ncbi:5-oxoprolinase subunit B family protein [Amycolatopsis sp. H20-H5]|uniref:5-oxoprolinase subunit B family protein n=1 Tax=Amycolatopsis sp. H20-H5 TaxID=3046309 RepID=UPI002DBDEAE9|nr:allophanate hydrolase subunit 1 [Amycolatopsis sp. H20-H5]MEC3975277.1 allophanate hydrolase subunit 1 [Amycolatopsis sp. H20-H5]